MALTLKQLVQVDISGDYLWSTDYTGAYDVDTNPGGYGGLNPNLNASALVMLGLRVSSNEKLELVGSQIKYSSSAENDFQNQWQLVYPSKDGWIQLWLMRIWVSEDAVTDVSGEHALADGDYFFIPSQSEKIYVKTGSGSSAYEEVEDFIELTESTDTENPYVQMCEDLFYNKTAKFKNNNLYKQYIQARKKDDSKEADELMYKMDDVMHSVQGADYAFRGGLKRKANDIIESTIDRYQIS